MNWKVRIKNKIFWMTIIPAVLLLVRQVLLLFGIDFDFTEIQENICLHTGSTRNGDSEYPEIDGAYKYQYNNGVRAYG